MAQYEDSLDGLLLEKFIKCYRLRVLAEANGGELYESTVARYNQLRGGIQFAMLVPVNELSYYFTYWGAAVCYVLPGKPLEDCESKVYLTGPYSVLLRRSDPPVRIDIEEQSIRYARFTLGGPFPDYEDHGNCGDYPENTWRYIYLRCPNQTSDEETGLPGEVVLSFFSQGARVEK